LQASPKGKGVKPKGRKKKAEPVKELEAAELPKGPAFAFEIDQPSWTAPKPQKAAAPLLASSL